MMRLAWWRRGKTDKVEPVLEVASAPPKAEAVEPQGSPPPAPRPESTTASAPPPAKAVARGTLGRLAYKVRLALLFAGGATAAGAAGIAGLLVHYSRTMPDPHALRQKERAPVVRVLARDGSVLAERGTPHDFMPIDLLPKHVLDAVVATEDRRFFEHWGIDPAGLARAALTNLRAGRTVQGGSTLTQQLAKNLFLSPERTLDRKLEELVLALWLEVRLSKRDILELYLNRVYFGGGAYGIEAAAQRYFAKSARNLTLAEAALVAGLLKAPSKYSPAASPTAARARGRSVLDKMRDAGLITVADHARGAKERVRFSAQKVAATPTGVEHAVDYALERLPPLVGSDHTEVIVETTIDAAVQTRAYGLLEQTLKSQGAAHGATQGAVVILDTEGGVRAMVGGRSYATSQFNRAAKARRQPGSAFKPVVYLAALEKGLTPDQLVPDTPITIEGWSPRNDSGQHLGAVTLRQGLAQSINSVAVRLQRDIGAREVVALARRLGISSDLRQEPSLALGTSEVTPLEMAGAYATLAGGGARISPHIIKRVRLSSGRVLFARQGAPAGAVIARTHAGAMNDMLNAALVSGTGRRAALPHHSAAGKTGTTQDHRDAWFIGYTAHLTAAVWVGNDDGRPMNKVSGGGLPAQIWREAMTVAHEGKAPLALPGMTRPVPADLPWASSAASAVPSQPRHPRERIDEAFLARVMGQEASTPSPPSPPLDQAQVPEAASQRVFGFDVGEIKRRLGFGTADAMKAPAEGRMSLGVKP